MSQTFDIFRTLRKLRGHVVHTRKLEPSLIRDCWSGTPVLVMTGPSHKKQKREEYRKAQQDFKDGAVQKVQLPKKKFYRQRAHANPFSDHNLT